MKRLFFTLAGIIIAATMMAQAPNAVKYQAVARDNAGDVIANQSVSLTISILQGSVTGTEVFTETHDSTTNAYGLVSLNIGAGNPTDFANIDWANGPYFIKVVMDGNEMGTSQLLSVPYAKYADEAGNVFSGSYNDLTDVPANMDKDATDDFDGDFNSLSNVPANLDTDATDDFDGDYNSLINTPDLSIYSTTDTTLDESEVDDMVSNNGYAMQAGLNDSIANLKGDLATVATSGDYADLSNAPDLSDTANYADQSALEDTASSLRNDLAPKNNVLGLDNTTAFTPDADYEPATKKYVDDNVGGSGHYVGELYGGGIVFWVTPDGQHGLIASLDDLDGGSGIAWSNVSSTQIGANAQSMTDGASNTAAIIAQSGHTSSAAKLCNDYAGGGFNDWYLPSNRELYLLASQDVLIDYILDNDGDGATNGFSHAAPTYGRYWSSTEIQSDWAYYYNFLYGSSNGNLVKTKTFSVRAVRAF